MIEQGQVGAAARVLKGFLAAVTMLCAGAAQAAIITTQGTWYGTNGMDGTLLGRNINGFPVNLLNAAGTAPNPDMVFVYDTELNLTWLANWNYANDDFKWGPATTVGTAMYWAANLTVGRFPGWSLPSTNTGPSSNCDSDFNPGSGYPQQYFGYKCTGSPMGEVWYTELGNTWGLRMTNTGTV